MVISVKDNTNKSVIKNVALITDILSKMIGLMFRKRGRILMRFAFHGKHSIWMPFMRFPIDIIYIDADKCIVDIISDAKPIGLDIQTWKIYYPCKKCKYILEVESGLAERKLFKVGDSLEF